MTIKVPKLKVRARKVDKGIPCAVELVAMLNCWSISTGGADAPKCADTATVLKRCMQTLPPKSRNTSSINYHLRRLGGKV